MSTFNNDKIDRAAETVADKAQDTANAVSDAARAASDKAGDFAKDAERAAAGAADRARQLAETGKDKTAGAFQSVAGMIDDNAQMIDDKFGKQYGDYARSAASTIRNLSNTIESQDMDQMVSSTRDFVKKSPAMAIGGAAVVGFILARMMRGNSDNA